ncbi:MAG: DUF1934 domain-containing protein [Lachnospiraceae bacterium]|nr:DUF1934 domain-containing protein [Lachnospiraceae bacterium]
MEQKVKVTVTGVHRHPGVQGEQTTQTVSEGMLRVEKNGVYLVEYEEYLEEENAVKEDGVVATYNLVTIAPSFMEIIRKGSVESVLRFAKDEVHETEYKTGFGAMRARVQTSKYQSYSLEKGRRVIAEVLYTVSMNGLEMSEVTMTIDIAPA